MQVNQGASMPSRHDQNLVYFSGLKMLDPQTNKYEYLIIASYSQQDQALINYKDRWQIETMFKAMKISGFNIENNHLIDMERISKLIALIAFAFVWAYKAGLNKHHTIKEIKLKKTEVWLIVFLNMG